MQMRSFVAACLALGMIACDARSPVVPTPQPITPITPAAPTDRSWGIVRDTRGNPVAGASITFWPQTGDASSNEAGEFEIPRVYLEDVFASKAGYESAWANADRFVQLTLHDIITISPGQSARVTVRPDDSLGGSGGRYRVRTIRVYSGGDRLVRVEVVADDNGPAEYWVQNDCGDVCPRLTVPSTFSLTGGSEVGVWIQIPYGSTQARTFTVETSAQEP